MQAEVRKWMRSELPHIQPPSDDTLRALTEKSTTIPLWKFLTGRVLLGTHADAARAGLLLTGEGYYAREEGYDEELCEIRKEIDGLEKEIMRLRNEVGEECIDDVGDCVEEAFVERDECIRRFIECFEDVEGEDVGLEDLLEEMGDDITETALREVDRLVEGTSTSGVLNVLKKQLSKAESRAVPTETATSRDITSSIEDHVIQISLKAYGEVCNLRDEHSAAAGKLREAVKSISEEGRGRLLAAQVAGERAVLAYSRDREGRGGVAMGRPRDVTDVDHAVERILEGNLRALAAVSQVFAAGDGFGMTVRAGVDDGVHAAMRMVRAAERGNTSAAERDRRVCVCELREGDISRVDAGLAAVESRLLRRAQDAAETRESVLERVDTKPLEEGLRAVRECRQVDCVRVRDELSAFVRQPGRAVGEWLIKG